MNFFITTLFNILNGCQKDDATYRMAMGLLKCSYDIENISINELANECEVSVSTLKRFMRKYDYSSYNIFRTMLVVQLDIRKKQMLHRLEMKDNNLTNSLLLKDRYHLDDNSIDNICLNIKKSNRVILIGSDEMISEFLRMQTDFYCMHKIVLKDEIYDKLFFNPQSDDYVIFLTMTGRIVDLNQGLLDKINKNNPKILTIGYKNYGGQEFLPIPKNQGELVENTVLDYYVQMISYTYMGNYYDN
ncbi:MAG: hypothetical protein PHH04_01520 [Thomasclavelia sp.]|nr:hypothetical protein [Thomasclavelia sp.]